MYDVITTIAKAIPSVSFFVSRKTIAERIFGVLLEKGFIVETRQNYVNLVNQLIELEYDLSEAKEEITRLKTAASEAGILTAAQRARQLFNQHRYRELKDLKKTRKKSWSALGFSSEEIEIINRNV